MCRVWLGRTREEEQGLDLVRRRERVLKAMGALPPILLFHGLLPLFYFLLKKCLLLRVLQLFSFPPPPLLPSR